MGRSWGITTFAVAILAVVVVAAADLDDSETIGDRNVLRVEIPTECPKIDPMNTTVHLAHESDCTKFYMCVHGHRVLFDCPMMDSDGNRLHFNPVLQVCDWPNKAGCKNGPTSTTTGTSPRPTTTKLTTRPNVETTTATYTTAKTTEATTVWTTEVSSASTIGVGTSGWSTELPTETTENTISQRPTTEGVTETIVVSTNPVSSTEIATESMTEITSQKTSTEIPTEQSTEETATTPTLEYSTEESLESTATWWPTEITSNPGPSTEHPTEGTGTTVTQMHSTEKSTEPTTEVISSSWPTVITSSPRPSTEQTTEETGTTATQTYSTEKLTEPTIEVTSSWWPTEITSSSRPSTQQPTEETGTTATQTYSTENLTEPTTEVTSSWWPTEITSSAEPSTEQPTEGTGTTATQTYSTEKLTEPTTEVTSSSWPTVITSSGEPSTEQPTEETGTTATQTYSTEKLTEPTTEIPISRWPTEETSSRDPPTDHSTEPTGTSATEKTDKPVESTTVTTTTGLSSPLSSTGSIVTVSTDGGDSTPTETPPTISTPTPDGVDLIQPSTPEITGIFIPHETNCSLYWQIVGDDKILMECPAGLHFNPATETCTWPDIAGCAVTTTPIPINTTLPDATCGIPCGQTGHGMLTPHECLCSKYYRCSNGDLILQECSKGLHFNPKTSTCDWPDLAGCMSSTVKPVTEPIYPLVCPTDSSGQTVLIPHLTNCSLYYKCEDSKKLLLQCPDDLHFNPQIQSCDWPDSASCISTTVPAQIYTTLRDGPKTTTAPGYTFVVPTECPPDNSGSLVLLPHRFNCSLFYTCDNGVKVVQSCPSGLHFNVGAQSCDVPENAACTAHGTNRPLITEVTSKPTDKNFTTPLWMTSIPMSSEKPHTNGLTTVTGLITGSECSTNGGRISHESNCSLYYECVNGKKELVSCASGLYFSPKLQLCVWPEDAGCISATDLPNPPTKPVESSSPIPIPTDELQQPETSRPTVQASTNQPSTGGLGRPNCIGSCPSKDPTEYTVLLPNEDCTLFCKCSNGRPYIYDCPPGLHFNPTKFVCDYPRKARCMGIGGFSNHRFEDFFVGI